MAATYQDVGTPQSGGAVQLTVPWPAHAVDDVAFLLVNSNSNVGLLTANGFVEAADSPQLGTTCGLQVFWCRATGTSMASPVTNTGNNNISAQIITVRGAVTSGDPWDVTVGGTGVLNTSIATPADMSTVDNTLVLFCIARSGDAAGANASGESNADVTNLAERIDMGTATGNGGGLVAYTADLAAAGTTGSVTATLVTTSTKAYVTIVIPPATAGTQALTGSLFTKAPTFPTGAITPGAVNLAGSLFTKAPTFNTGAVTATRNLAGSLFTKAPTFPTGTVTATRNLGGVLFTKAPTFPQGAVALVSGPQTVTGVLFTKAPTFNVGTVTAAYNLTGVLFSKAPTFFTGAVTPGAVNLAGILFQKAPTFPAGTVSQLGGPQLLGGTLFQKAPTFPQGTVTAGSVNLAGVLFQKAPTFPTGTITATVNLGGVLFVKAPTFPTGTLGIAGGLSGILYVNTPLFFTGAMSQTGGSFWTPNPVAFTVNPVGYTLNPAAFVAVGPAGPIPWPIEMHGILFAKAPTFPVGAVT